MYECVNSALENFLSTFDDRDCAYSVTKIVSFFWRQILCRKKTLNCVNVFKLRFVQIGLPILGFKNIGYCTLKCGKLKIYFLWSYNVQNYPVESNF